MKHRSREPVTETKLRTVGMVCDICGEACANPQSGNWGPSGGDSFYTNVGCYGSASWDYAGVESAHETDFDICRRCWEDKLVPFITRQAGAPPPPAEETK